MWRVKSLTRFWPDGLTSMTTKPPLTRSIGFLVPSLSMNLSGGCAHAASAWPRSARPATLFAHRFRGPRRKVSLRRNLSSFHLALVTFVSAFAAGLYGAESPPARMTLVRAVDLDVNESQEIELADRTRARVKLIWLTEARDTPRDAVREARVTVQLNCHSLVLTSPTYHLPIKFGGVQIDCPITKGHVTNSSEGNAWGLLKDARLRLWPANSPWIEPGTFVYPLKQSWFASHTQMANEPSFVDGGEAPANKNIYYHYGLDSGGAE